MEKKSSLSTTADKLQRQREQREIERSREGGLRSRSQLVAKGSEAATEYGVKLFRQYGQAVQLGLDAALTDFCLGPASAGPYYAALPVLLHFTGRGPAQVAAVALRVVLDNLSRKQSLRALQRTVGRAIEAEVKAMQLNPDAWRLLKRQRGTKAALGKGTLAQLGVQHERWSADCCATVGGLLVELIRSETPLLEVTTKPGSSSKHPPLMVEATATARQIIAANPPRPLSLRRLPMLVEPRPWTGLQGGGHLGGESKLVNCRARADLGYLKAADLSTALRVVNRLQGQQMAVDPWMVEQQRTAWDANIRGLFPVQRDPLTAPPRPQETVGPEAMRRWHAEVLASKVDRTTHAGLRARIESSIEQCQEVAGLPLWFAYDLDFRGRVYSSNRYATHQGPDWEKAAVAFGRGEPCDAAAADWLLMAAAGHWGLGRVTWEERLAWGRENAGRLLAAAEEPLDRLEAWRDAKDPWQFLQVARAFSRWHADHSALIHCPIRLDQTTSGLGILAALTRDRRIAESCNLIGNTPNDLYGEVATQLEKVIRRDLEYGTESDRRNAELWLEAGIDRALMKGPVMTTTYGAMYQGLLDGFVEQLLERNGPVPTGQIEKRLLRPARFMAVRVSALLKDEVAACLAVQKWLRETCRKVVSAQQHIGWTSPMGFPVQLSADMEDTSRITTLAHGRPRWATVKDQKRAGELSALVANRGITANVVHTFDAAFCWIMVCRAEAQGIDLLTNHDCFATLPSRAGWLHKTLHDELRELYKTDWLEQLAAEIRSGAAGVAVAAPPKVGTLCPGEIGHNGYAFC